MMINASKSDSEEDLGSDIEADLRGIDLDSISSQFETHSDSLFSVTNDLDSLGSPHVSRVSNGQSLRISRLTKVSNQLLVYQRRNNSGLPTCINFSKLVAIGTQNGIVFIFDMKQNLRTCLSTAQYSGGRDLPGSESPHAIVHLDQTPDSTRLLTSMTSGRLLMWAVTVDSRNVEGSLIDDPAVKEPATGSRNSLLDVHHLRQKPTRLLRVIEDAFSPGAHLSTCYFTTQHYFAVSLDSYGVVHRLTFKRGLMGRTCESSCVFSDAQNPVKNALPLPMLFGDGESSPSSNSSSSLVSLDRLSSGIGPFRAANQQLGIAAFMPVALVTRQHVFVAQLKPRFMIISSYSTKSAASALHWRWDRKTGPAAEGRRASLAFSVAESLVIMSVSAVIRKLDSITQQDLPFNDKVMNSLKSSSSLLVHPMHRIALSGVPSTLHWLGEDNLLLGDAASASLHLLDASDHCQNGESLPLESDERIQAASAKRSQLLLLTQSGAVVCVTLKQWRQRLEAMVAGGQLGAAFELCRARLLGYSGSELHARVQLDVLAVVQLALESIPPNAVAQWLNPASLDLLLQLCILLNDL